MLRFLHGPDLARRPALAAEMFRDRARQFRDRLGWPVRVDAQGWERDDYDAAGPLYVICEDAAGRHGGSARLLPTTGPAMVNDHFLHLTDGVALRSPLIWEVTRLCLAPGAGPGVAPALLLGMAELMRRFDLTHLVGVFEARMERVYRRLGAAPEVLGRQGDVAVGLWPATARPSARLLARAAVGAAQVERWADDDLDAGTDATRMTV